MSSDANENSAGKSGLVLVDEALSLVRNTLDTGFHYYLLGTLPFLLGLVFFCMAMLRSSFAAQNALAFSFVLAVLFLWMKTAHSLYCHHLLTTIQGIDPPPFSISRLIAVAKRQVLVQATGPFLLSIALLFAVPFGWVYAFYQHVTVYSGRTNSGSTAPMSRAVDRGKQWPRQNHMFLLFMSLFAGTVYFGVLVLLLFLPVLLKRLTGVQTMFTRASVEQIFMFIMDPTFHAIALSLTYLIADPIVKAAYVLRTFYGESVRSGEDLKTKLRFLASKAGERGVTAMLLLASVFSVLTGVVATAQSGDRTPVDSERERNRNVSISNNQLDRNIEREISSFRYDWRLPRKKEVLNQEEKQGWLADFFDEIGKSIERILDSINTFLEDLFGDGQKEPVDSSRSTAWTETDVSTLIWIVLAVFAGGFGVYLLLRRWRSEKEVEEQVDAPAGPDVDLEEEEVDPEAMSSNRWEDRAKELVERQEYRKAVRALYLASLSCLGSNQLIDIKKYKSNSSYQRELARRAGDTEERVHAFRDNVQQFERLWYGRQEATPQHFESFRKNYQRIVSDLDRHET